MAKDSKKGKVDKESKLGPKDKDIHLNVVGVPKKNVDIKKTYPRQNNEDYQLYRISIDTKGKHKDRKHRMSSLEPSSKKPKTRKRHKSYDNDIVSSNDSDTDVYRPQKRKNSAGQKEKPSTPKSKMKGDVDSEVCFTIPGEKGKAIRIVGSSTKARDDSLPRESSPQPKRTKQSKPESQRQVGFSRLDEVYGSTPDEKSFTSRDSSPYRQDSPQVYKMENNSPNSPFNDSKNSSNVPRRNADRGNDENLDKPLSRNLTSYPKNRLEEQSKPSLRSSQASLPLSKSSKEEQDRKPKNKEPLAGASKPRRDKPSTSKGDEGETDLSSSKQSAPSRPRSGHKSINETSSTLPSTSYVSSDYDLSLGSTTDSKGKYPFYPYDKQKRGKSPPNQLQEPKSAKQEDRESYTHQKLPSIPEVRSTEHYPSPHPSGSEGVIIPPKESSVDKITRPNEYSRNTSPTPLSPKEKNMAKIQPSSNSLTNTKNDISGNKPISHDLSTSSQMQKPSRTTLSNEQRDTIRDNPILHGLPKTNQAQKPPQNISQSTSTITSKVQKKNGSPVVQNYNVQNTPSKLEAPSTNKGELQNKSQGPGMKVRYSPYSMKNTPSQKEAPNTNKRELQSKPQGPAPGMKERSSPYSMKNTPSRQEAPRTNKRELKNQPQGPTSGIMAGNSPLPETSNKVRNVEQTREPTLKKDQAAVNNKTPIINKGPITVDRETMTDKPFLSQKEKIMKEISDELLRNSSSVHQTSLVGSAKRDDSSHEKDSKRTKSRLSNFVSSIPKPSFKRNKSLEKKSTDKSVISNKNQPQLSPLEKNPDLTGGKVNVKDEARKPVEESAIVKQAHSPVVEAYPDWVTSSDQKQPKQGGKDFQPQGFKDSPLSDINALKSSKEYLPFGMDDSSSVEIANRSYGEHPLAGAASIVASVHEQTSKPLFVASNEEDSPNYLGRQNEMSKADDSPKEAWKPPYSENRKQLQDSHSNASSQSDLERIKDPDYNNYGKDKSIYQGPNVVAYPGQITEETPFRYELKNEDPKEENEAIKSLQDAFEAKNMPNKDRLDLPTRSVDRNPSLVSRASRNPEEELKNKYYGRPIQVLKGSTDSLLTPDKITPREVSYDPNKYAQSTDRGFGRGKRIAEPPRSTGSMSRLKITPTSLDGQEVKVKPVSKSPFGKTPEEQVYLSNSPDDYNAFNPQYFNDEVSPYKGKVKPPITERQGPKGILIFVNKKNETANPFQKSSPSRKDEDKSTKPKGNGGQKKIKKRKTSSSGDTTASTSVQSSSLYASGDKKSMVERTPSGSKITETYPCGCIRMLKTDPRNSLKKEEIISAFCKNGSKCEVGKRQRTMLGRSADSSSISWEGSRPGRGMLPEIEVIADGVVSKKPINSRKPAPTMNGAKLTGTFKIKSNKVNGVCNLYLDKKLKNYLRNNMDKLKLLLEDDDKR